MLRGDILNCYFCGCTLTEQNKSMEHIVSNALGGKLKSDKLLCKKCNNDMGCWEDELSKKLMYFITSLEIKRERGKIPVYTAVTSDNKKVYIKPGFIVDEGTTYKKEGNTIQITATE